MFDKKFILCLRTDFHLVSAKVVRTLCLTVFLFTFFYVYEIESFSKISCALLLVAQLID